MYVPVDLSSSPLPWHGAVYRWRGYWTPGMGASGPWRRRWDSVAKGPSSDSKPRIKGQFFSKVSRCVSDIFQNKNCRACRFLPPLFKKICLIVFNSIEVLQTVDDDLGLILWYKREESGIFLVTTYSLDVRAYKLLANHGVQKSTQIIVWYGGSVLRTPFLINETWISRKIP